MNPCLTGEGSIKRLGRVYSVATEEALCAPRIAIGNNWAKFEEEREKNNIIAINYKFVTRSIYSFYL